MKAAILIRACSFGGSPASEKDLFAAAAVSGGGGCSLRPNQSSVQILPPRSALHLDPLNRLPRARSDTDLVGSIRSAPISALWSPPARVLEEGKQDEEEEQVEDFNGEKFDLGVWDLWGSPALTPAAVTDGDVSGGGMGKGRKIGGGGGGGGKDGGGGNGERRMDDYYKELLKVDPENSLLLTNYGRFLHEVEGDVKGAEECYGRAILASPRDGEVLSLYGKLVWETQGDDKRAEGYFERAVEASPDDCYVLGSYANFLWDAGEDEEEGDVAASSPLVEAF